MTEPKRILRPRRTSGKTDSIPPEVAQWFAAGCPATVAIPWSALLPGDFERLPARWAEWKAANPGIEPDPSSLFLLEPSR